MQTAGRDLVAMQTGERGNDETVLCDKLTGRAGVAWGVRTIFHLCPDHFAIVHFNLKMQLNWEQIRRPRNDGNREKYTYLVISSG